MRLLAQTESATYLKTLPSWRVETGKLIRDFEFEDFLGSLRFVNRVGTIAEEAGHHPDIEIRYNRVRLSLVSHDAGGLTDMDFEMAMRIDELT